MYHRKLPEIGWDDLTVRMFLDYMASFDANNHLASVGVGEREGRVYSNIVKDRHFAFVHGVGRLV